MSDQFLGEIRCFGFNFAPYGWALCNGQILPISQYSALFSLLGTNFGGNGTSNFGLPNLQSRVALDVGTLQGGSTYVVGEQAGSENVTLIANNLPAHTHAFNIGVAPYVAGDYSKQPVSLVTWPGELVDQSSQSLKVYHPSSNATQVTMNSAAIGPTGGNQPHSNLQPFLVMNFCIAMQGIYPSRN